MSSEERRKILQMVEEGKISAEEAARLMRAIEDDAVEAGAEVEVIQPAAHSGYEKTEAPEFDAIKSRARKFALIPLWAGIFVTVFSAWVIYSIQQNAGTNFWFYCMTLPLLLGVLLIALDSGGLRAGFTSTWTGAMPNPATDRVTSRLGSRSRSASLPGSLKRSRITSAGWITARQKGSLR